MSMCNIKKYDEIFTLGPNCELAFKIQQCFGSIESYLFNWAVANPHDMLKVLENPTLVFSEKIEEIKETNMWRCSITNLIFHGKSSVQELSDPDVFISRYKRDIEKNEVISRVKYLTDKFQNALQSIEKKLFAIEIRDDFFKFSVTGITSFISNLYNVLSKITNNFDLLCILRKEFDIDEINSVQNGNIYIRFVNYFAPYDKATSENFIDIVSSKRIFNEFRLKDDVENNRSSNLINYNQEINKNSSNILLTDKKDKNSLRQNKIKILVSYHTPALLLKNDILTPIHAGRSVAASRSKDGNLDKESLAWLNDNMIGDNTGDNISDKNRFYNEITSVYWAWKNQQQLDYPDYIGFMHYRRQFLFDDEKCSKYSNSSFFAPESQYRISCLSDSDIVELFSEKQIQNAVNGYDLIVTRPAEYKNITVYEQYKLESRFHEISDLDKICLIIKNKFPAFSESVDTYLNSDKHYFWNMFIMKKELFNEFCQWMFSIFEDFEKVIDISSRTIVKKRVYAYLSERLVGIYITYLKMKNNLKISEKWSIFEEYTNICTEIKPSYSNKCIPIVFSSDNNYSSYLAVAIKSLAENTSTEYNYDIFVLDEDISTYNKTLIEAMIVQYNNISLRFIKVSPYIKDVPREIFYCHGHFSISTYYRFFIARIFKNFQKVIYLDCDLVILDDIAKLFKIDIEDYVLAAALDVEVTRAIYNDERYCPQRLCYYKNTLGMKDPYNYFQAGVLLLNINQMIDMNFEKICIDQLIKIKTPEYVDQDILNSLLEGKIKYFDISWNLEWHLPLFHKNIVTILPNDILDEYQAAYNEPKIIHYCSSYKPWKDPCLPLSQYFWQYAKLTPFYESIIFHNLKIFSKTEAPTETVKVQEFDINNHNLIVMLKEVFYYRRTKFKYMYYKFLSKICWGKKRKRYKEKRKKFRAETHRIRNLIKSIR